MPDPLDITRMGYAALRHVTELSRPGEPSTPSHEPGSTFRGEYRGTSKVCIAGVIRPSLVREGAPSSGATATAGEDGAGDEVRTRDIQLGRLTLCQLSYSRSSAEDTAVL